jgi:Fungal Zn(2)-Cys(6) binuclear cluster domain
MSSEQTQPLPVQDTVRAVVPRKRRRRAPATGATNDCFTCVTRKRKCDRRRPYCSQCLEHGKECSGYKTQLTWGVGVASRGKLRGLALPIASSAKAAPAEPPRSVTTKKKAVSPVRREGSMPPQQSMSTQQPLPSLDERDDYPRAHTPIERPSTAFDFVNSPAPMNSPVPSSAHSVSYPEVDWPQTSYAESTESSHGYSNSHPPHGLHLVSSGLMNSWDDVSVPQSASSISGYSDSYSDYPSPMDFPQTPEEMGYLSPPLPVYNSMYQQPTFNISTSSASVMDNRRPTSYPGTHFHPHRESMSSNHSGYEVLHEGSTTSHHSFGSHHGSMPGSPMNPVGPCNLADVFYDDDIPGTMALSSDVIPITDGSYRWSYGFE